MWWWWILFLNLISKTTKLNFNIKIKIKFNHRQDTNNKKLILKEKRSNRYRHERLYRISAAKIPPIYWKPFTSLAKYIQWNSRATTEYEFVYFVTAKRDTSTYCGVWSRSVASFTRFRYRTRDGAVKWQRKLAPNVGLDAPFLTIFFRSLEGW